MALQAWSRERNAVRLRELDTSPDEHVTAADSTDEVSNRDRMRAKRGPGVDWNLGLIVDAKAVENPRNPDLFGAM